MENNDTNIEIFDVEKGNGNRENSDEKSRKKENGDRRNNDMLDFDTQEKKKKSGGCLTAIVITLFSVVALIFIALFIGIIMFILNLSSSGVFPEFPFSSSYPVVLQEEYLQGDNNSKNKIAVIDIRGIILRGGASFSQVADCENISEQLKYIEHQSDVKAVILRLDTPGGEITAADEIHHAVLKLKKKRHIPVVACMQSIAASGGYYVAVACDYIIANRMTITGSIGVITETYKYYELLRKIGVTPEVYVSRPMKDLLSGVRPTREEERRLIKSLIEQSYNQFVQVVAEGRKAITAEKIKNSIIGDGRIFPGEQAYKLKLIDGLGFFDDAISKAARMANIKDYKVIIYRKPFSFRELFSAESAKTNRKIDILLPGISKHWLSVMEPGKLYYMPSIEW